MQGKTMALVRGAAAFSVASVYVFGEPLRRLQGLGRVPIGTGIACLPAGK